MSSIFLHCANMQEIWATNWRSHCAWDDI